MFPLSINTADMSKVVLFEKRSVGFQVGEVCIQLKHFTEN